MKNRAAGRLTRQPLALGALLLLSGCGSARLAASQGCARYIAHVNGLDCTWLELPDARTCPVTSPPACDLEAFYDCLAANTTCTHGVLDGSAAVACALSC